MNTFAAVFAACLALTSAFPSGLPLPEGLRSSSGCGVSKMVYDGDRIVGGRDALEGEFPWQISLQRSGSHICGGSIYNEKSIITAAHCVLGSTSSYSVVVGSHRRRNTDPYQKTHRIQKIIIHERYDDYTIKNDIAILILAEPIDFAASNGYVNPVCLPAAMGDHTGLVTATGWGALKEGGSSPNILQAVEVPVVKNVDCKRAYGSKIIESMMCAGVSKGGKDSCQGDSGGPLIQRIDGKATLVGIVSWGYGCARPTLPGVYTRVSHYIDWIAKKTV